ncbi:MAG: hypothetical protein ACW991_10655 [Candidatus Hodarchaeales archaeon]|jgi:hypothetical protein
MKISKFFLVFVLFIIITVGLNYQNQNDQTSQIIRFKPHSKILTIVQDNFMSEYDIHVADAFYVAVAILFILPFITIYFLPKENTKSLTLKGLLKLLLLDGFFIAGFILLEVIANPTNPFYNPFFQPETSEFLIVSFLWLFIYATIFYPYFLELLRISIVYEVDLNNQQLIRAVEDSIGMLSGRRIRSTEELPNFFQYHITGSYFLKYKLNVLIGEKPENENLSRVNFTFIHSLRNLNILKVLTFIMFGTMLFARANWSLQPTLMGTTYDAEVLFTLFVFAFIFFNLLIAHIAENLIFQREAAHKEALVNINRLGLSKPDLDEIKQRARAKLGHGRPDIQEIKQKAQDRINISIQKAEQEKQERIDMILDRADSKLTPQINPEIIRMEALIRETKKILNATPKANSVELTKIVDMLGGSDKTSKEEIEQLIIGMVNKGEVNGEYDIWTRTYSSGNTRTRFMNRTLESLKIKKDEIADLKVSGDSMEVTLRNKSGEDRKETKKTRKKSDEQNKSS